MVSVRSHMWYQCGHSCGISAVTHVVSVRSHIWYPYGHTCGISAVTHVVSVRSHMWYRCGHTCCISTVTHVVSVRSHMWYQYGHTCGISRGSAAMTHECILIKFSDLQTTPAWRDRAECMRDGVPPVLPAQQQQQAVPRQNVQPAWRATDPEAEGGLALHQQSAG